MQGWPGWNVKTRIAGSYTAWRQVTGLGVWQSQYRTQQKQAGVCPVREGRHARRRDPALYDVVGLNLQS